MILIDSSLGSRDLVKYRPLNNPSVATKTSLESADVCFFGNGADRDLLIGIELKNMPDIIKGVTDGRFVAQLQCMRDRYDVCYVLIYGAYMCGPGDTLYYRKTADGAWKDGGAKYLFIESLLMDAADSGIIVKIVPDLEQAALWIATCARQWSKPFDLRGVRFGGFNLASRNMLRARMKREEKLGEREKDPDQRDRAEVVHAIPGIGIDKAMALVDHFDSLHQIFNAEPAQLAAVRGIGKVVSKAAVEFIRRTKRTRGA